MRVERFDDKLASLPGQTLENTRHGLKLCATDGVKSGRLVISRNSGSLGARWISRSRNSLVLASTQCTSSNNMNKGALEVSLTIVASSVCRTSRRCWPGLKLCRGYRSSVGLTATTPEAAPRWTLQARPPTACARAFELLLRRIGGNKPGGVLDMPADGIERAVLVVRRAVTNQIGGPLTNQAAPERGGKSRLSNARFARQQHGLSSAGVCLKPAIFQKCQLFIAADQRREASLGADSLELVPNRVFGSHTPGLNRIGKAFEVIAAQIVVFEQAPDELLGRVGNDDTVRLTQNLQAGREIWDSPATVLSCASPVPIMPPTTTSPVAIPTLVDSTSPGRNRNALTAETRANPARTARSGSYSLARG